MLRRFRWLPQSIQAHNDIAPTSHHPILLTLSLIPFGSSPFMSSTLIYSSRPLINYNKKKKKKKKKMKMKKMKKIDLLLRKCKSLSRQLGRSSSYSSLRSKSTREDVWGGMHGEEEEQREPILVGSSRRRYMISSKYLSHPLLSALIDKSNHSPGGAVLVKCEVVLFDHLLWMLDNGDPNLSSESLEELVDLYVL